MKFFQTIQVVIFLTILLLLVPSSGCRDTEKEFQLDDEKTPQTCFDAKINPELCNFSTVREKCNYTCFKCCEDQKEDFFQIYPDLSWETPKKCSMIQQHPDLCEKSQKWRDSCPRSCGTCPCFDNPGKFIQRVNGVPRSCFIAAQNSNKCKMRLFRENCPRTCNICPKPKVFKLRCDIDAKLSYPALDEIEYYGYSSDYVTVTKRLGDESCGYQRRRTSWGCIHEGTARIFKLNDERYYSLRESEYVHISNAENSSYDFVIQHYFSDNELYYEGDENLLGTLAIKAGKNKLKKFSRPRNKNQDTHNEDGSINQSFKDSARIRVTCDGECSCSMKKVQE